MTKRLNGVRTKDQFDSVASRSETATEGTINGWELFLTNISISSRVFTKDMFERNCLRALVQMYEVSDISAHDVMRMLRQYYGINTERKTIVHISLINNLDVTVCLNRIHECLEKLQLPIYKRMLLDGVMTELALQRGSSITHSSFDREEHSLGK